MTNPVLSWRHELHQIAETAFDEHRTASYIAAGLTALGLDVTTGVGGTGVVGTLRGGTSKKSIGLRADMDGLPLQESTGLDYSSRHEGRMHACGHDGHMAMVLGAAAALAKDASLDGTVHFVFQPAEEPGRGAQAMIDDGLFDRFRMDAIFGLHNIPGLPAGQLATRTGAIMAGEDNFSITITGRGGHASAPHLVIDPLVVASQVILGLQSIVSRSIDPTQSAVISCTDVTTDGARNAIPSTVRITGDTRNFDAATSALIESRLREVAESTARAHGAQAEVSYTREFGTTVNHTEATHDAVRAALAASGAGGCESETAPIMGSEDFGVYAEHVPANFTFIGNGTDSAPLHSHDYDFNDAILPIGVRYYENLVRQLLSR